MLLNDIEAIQSDPNFSIEASNGVYIVYLIIGIIIELILTKHDKLSSFFVTFATIFYLSHGCIFNKSNKSRLSRAEQNESLVG